MPDSFFKKAINLRAGDRTPWYTVLKSPVRKIENPALVTVWVRFTDTDQEGSVEGHIHEEVEVYG